MLFAGLGVWQVERLWWKLDLIQRVDARVHASPVRAPPAARFAQLDPRDVEYRHVRATGIFLPDRQTLVDALTELGAGYWVMTPLKTRHGIILVNRGFIPKQARRGETRAPAPVTSPAAITGLLRLSEPDGRFLRPNKPEQDLWYSRDVTAIARARGLRDVGPYFIDADATANPGGYPVGGLTVIHFRNTHLIYALTWFALAGLCIFGLVLLLRPRRTDC